MTANQNDILDLVVVGGGIAGLAAAWTAHQRGWRVRVLEAGRSVGGKMRSERVEGYLVEHGPNSFLGSAATLWQLVEELGLVDEVAKARTPADRYVFRNRRARRLPQGPGSLLSGDYMTLGGKLRLLAEPFVLGDATEGDTVADFAQRRLGAEAAQYLVAPFVSGVFAGDPDQLGARDAFPRLWQWEHDAGSMVMGALLGWTLRRDRPGADAAGKVVRRGMYSFVDGMGALPKAIAARLPEGSVQTGAVVSAVEQVPAGFDGFEIRYGAMASHEPQTAVRARRVVVALPARAAAGLFRDLPHVHDGLSHVDVCRVAVVHMGGPDPEGLAPQGFGVLYPPGEGLRTLGILMPSSLFPNRAPEGCWLHTGFIGGARDPDAVDLPDETLISLVRRAQQQAFGHLFPGRELPCTFTKVVRWRDAIPQYRVGHRAAMAALLGQVEAALPGLTLAGNHLQGISVDDAARSGVDAIERLAAALPIGELPVPARAGWRSLSAS